MCYGRKGQQNDECYPKGYCKTESRAHLAFTQKTEPVDGLGNARLFKLLHVGKQTEELEQIWNETILMAESMEVVIIEGQPEKI